ncbi:MAG TPA: argininosuccinate synthase, partial [Aggregatilineaceae bacterium]|nr:argininosuccinate synthase [Aggregatilineaceae bacterium]
MDPVKKVVLAYSGGLDTSIIVPWLRNNYHCEVVCFCADLGQGEELDGLEEKALKTGASKLYVRDLREEFLRDFVFPTIQSGAIYERTYLLGTSFARPVIARHLVEIAEQEGADAIAHGCTGKGNDQVRFELTVMALNPRLQVIAPWREWDIRSREDALAYAEEYNVPVSSSLKSIYSRDRNLFHMSHEAGPLEDPWNEPEEIMYQISASPENAPEQAAYVEIEFECGNPVAVNGEKLSPAKIVECLRAAGCAPRRTAAGRSHPRSPGTAHTPQV